MDISVEKMSQPEKFTIKEEAKDFKKRKEIAYNKIKKDLPAIDGFRKGTIPRGVAEQKFEVDKLYKGVVDDIYIELSEKYNIIAASDFEFFGDLKNDEAPFTMVFKAEIKPKIELVDLDSLSFEKESEDVSEEEINKTIELDLKRAEKEEETDKEILENFDIAIINYEGILEGEDKPFKGGSAKDFKICVNEIINGRHQFIDNFEDQIVGMRINEKKEVNVKFPDDYRDKTKAGKKAKFIVTLNAIKKKVRPELDDDFAYKNGGHKNLEEYKNSIKEIIFNKKKMENDSNFKRKIINGIIEKSEISPIPEIMINDEIKKEWKAYLNRIGKSEEDLLKEHGDIKTRYLNSIKPQIVETLKVSLILEEISKKINIEVTKNEVEDYVLALSKTLNHDEEKRKKIIGDLHKNEQRYKMMEKGKINEKIVEYLVEKYS